MQVGDIVRRKYFVPGQTRGLTGIVLSLIEKRSVGYQEMNHRFDWEDRKLEPHAEVLILGETAVIRIADLELVAKNEER